MMSTIPKLSIGQFTTIRRVWKISSVASPSRSYATATRAKPRAAAAKSTTAVKGTRAAAKPLKRVVKPKSAAAAKKKKKTAVKAKPKAKKAAKKAVKKPAPKKRVLSEKRKTALARSKEVARVKQLKEVALYRTEPTKLPNSGWSVYQTEALKKNSPTNKTEFSKAMTDVSQAFKALPPAEHDRLNAVALQNRATNEAAYESWVTSHTPRQIYDANIARSRLRRLSAGKRAANSHKLVKIQDSRAPKGLRNPLLFFMADKWATGQFKGLAPKEAVKQGSVEWAAMSAEQKKKFVELSAADKLRVRQEKDTVFQ